MFAFTLIFGCTASMEVTVHYLQCGSHKTTSFHSCIPNTLLTLKWQYVCACNKNLTAITGIQYIFLHKRIYRLESAFVERFAVLFSEETSLNSGLGTCIFSVVPMPTWFHIKVCNENTSHKLLSWTNWSQLMVLIWGDCGAFRKQDLARGSKPMCMQGKGKVKWL